jgi:hypothetical protein
MQVQSQGTESGVVGVGKVVDDGVEGIATLDVVLEGFWKETSQSL